MNPPTTARDVSGKAYAELFFTREALGGKTWHWKSLNMLIKQSGSGYTNLQSHVRCVHPNYYEKLLVNFCNDQKLSFSRPPKVLWVHAWIKFIVLGLQQFSSTRENKIFVKHMKVDGLTVETKMSFLASVTRIVERKIIQALPDLFSFVIDVEICAETHFAPIFASFFTIRCES